MYSSCHEPLRAQGLVLPHGAVRNPPLRTIARATIRQQKLPRLPQPRHQQREPQSLSTTPAEHPERWEKVLRRLRGRTMPPIGIPIRRRPPTSQPSSPSKQPWTPSNPTPAAPTPFAASTAPNTKTPSATSSPSMSMSPTSSPPTNPATASTTSLSAISRPPSSNAI